MNHAQARSTARAHVRIRGRVQGVGFRFSTRDEAAQRGVRGWVRNLANGDVEAVFEGPPAAVQQMVQWCRVGPPGAHVSAVDVDWDEPPEGAQGFAIRHTAYPGHSGD